MTQAFDITKFRKSITKSINGLSTGFSDPRYWVSTGNYTLNKLISGNFFLGIPLSKVTMFAGESGSGKSFICSGNIVRDAQDQGIFVILIDSENALDETWLHALGVSTDEGHLLKINAAMIDDVGKTISEFAKEYKSTYEGVEEEDRPKVLIVVDSLGMLLTPTDVKQFESGDMKGDMGRKAKQLRALIVNCVNLLANLNIGMVVTNHTYASQDIFDPEDKISGGNGPIFASSIVVAIRKLKLKEDEEGNKVGDVRGIRAACKIMKTRFSKPFETTEIKIPWDRGMDPYSGLDEFFEKHGVLYKTGKMLGYKDPADGQEIKMFRKHWQANKNGMLDKLMNVYQNEIEVVNNE